MQRSFLTLCLAAVLAGCSYGTVFDPGSIRSIHRIAILPPTGPVHYIPRLIQEGPPLIQMISGLAHAQVPDDLNARVTQAMEADGLNPLDELTRSLAEALRADGYEIVIVPTPRQTPTTLLETYAGLDLHADAVLDVVMTPMVVDTDLRPYSPMLGLSAKLVRLTDNRVLYTFPARYRTETGSVDTTGLSNGTRYQFTAAELISDHTELAEDFHMLIRAAVASIAQTLQKQT